MKLLFKRQYTLHDGYCQKAIPTIHATPVTHISGGDSMTPSYMTHMTTYLVDATAAHHPLVILFQEKDQDVLGLVDDDLAHSDTPSPPSKSSSSADALPLGAKIGIGLGVGGAVSILVLLIYYLLRRRRNISEKAAMQMAGFPNGIAACRSDVSSSDASLGATRPRRHGPQPDPPPPFEPSPRQLSPRDSAERAEPSGDELKALRAQQEAIQRRIEQLERGE